MSALGEAIAAWRALPVAERDKLVDFLKDDTGIQRAQLRLRPTPEERAEAEWWIRVNEAALALLVAAARHVPGAPPLDRIKEAARRAARDRAG